LSVPVKKQREPQQKHPRLELAVAVASRVLEISGSRRAESTAWRGKLLLVNMKERLKKENLVIHTILLKKFQWFLSLHVLSLSVAGGTAAAKGKEGKSCQIHQRKLISPVVSFPSFQ